MSQTMEIRLAGGRKIDARYNGFEMRTDQSVKNGGEASAPEPFDLFLASLGTCAGHYVNSFCHKREIPTEGIRIVQSWSRDAQRRLETIRIEIRVPDDFPEKYRAALVRAADQCSVRKVLLAPPAVEATLTVGA
jgi:ribosomal protein S12 methylthiotransferase accessory factor